MRVLIADDHRSVRQAVRAILSFEDDIDVVGEAADGQQTLELARRLRPDAVVLDSSMPRLTGLEVARRLASELPKTAVVFHSLDSEVRDEALAAGAEAFVLKDAPMAELLRAVRGAGGKAQRSPGRRQRDRLYVASVHVLSAVLEVKDSGALLGNHHLAAIARRMCALLGVSERDAERIELATLLRDIGKVAVPEAILKKATPLLTEERRYVALHATLGAAILEDSEVLRELAPIVRHHHESFDGSGYPDGLAGDAIPLGTQIVGLLDAFNGITSPRPYKRALSSDFAIEQLALASARQFSPRLLQALLKLHRREPELFLGAQLSARAQHVDGVV